MYDSFTLYLDIDIAKLASNDFPKYMSIVLYN